MTRYAANDIKWEYTVSRVPFDTWDDASANAYGEQGWELVSAVPYIQEGFGVDIKMILVVYKHPYIEDQDE